MSNLRRKRRDRIWLVRSTPQRLSDYFRLYYDWQKMLRAIRFTTRNPEGAFAPFCDSYEIFQLDLERVGEPGGMIEVTGEAKAAALQHPEEIAGAVR